MAFLPLLILRQVRPVPRRLDQGPPDPGRSPRGRRRFSGSRVPADVDERITELAAGHAPAPRTGSARSRSVPVASVPRLQRLRRDHDERLKLGRKFFDHPGTSTGARPASPGTAEPRAAAEAPAPSSQCQSPHRTLQLRRFDHQQIQYGGKPHASEPARYLQVTKRAGSGTEPSSVTVGTRTSR